MSSRVGAVRDVDPSLLELIDLLQQVVADPLDARNELARRRLRPVIRRCRPLPVALRRRVRRARWFPRD